MQLSWCPSLEDVSHLDITALCLLEDLRDLTEKEIKFRELSVRIGSSVGVASLTKPTEELAKFPKGTPVRVLLTSSRSLRLVTMRNSELYRRLLRVRASNLPSLMRERERENERRMSRI